MKFYFRFKTADRISGLGSVVLWLSRWGVVNILFRYYTVTLSKVVFLQRSSSVKGHLPWKVVFRERLSSVKGRLQWKVVFRERSSSAKGFLLSKDVFPERSSSVKGCLLSKVVFRHRSSSVLVVSYVLTINGAHESSKINLKIEFFHKDSLGSNI